MEFNDLALFITGPTYIRPEVRLAAALPEFGHRDTEAATRFDPIFHGLRALAGLGDDPAADGYHLALVPGSGSNALETLIRSLVADDETVLNISVGAFGDLFHNIAVFNGKKHVQHKVTPGQAMDLEVVEALLQTERPAVVTMTHNETSTGVFHENIAAFCALVRRYGALPLVDGVSIFGGVAVDLPAMGCAGYATATQKSLALPAGVGICFVSQEAVEKSRQVKNKGYVTDIVRHLERAAKHQTLSTPSTSLANQMAVQLDYILRVEGMQARFARHLRLRDQAHAFAAGLAGFELFAPEGCRSPSATAVQCPSSMTAADLKALKEAMRARGFLFDTGYMKMNTALEAAGAPPVFRIGHMGDITEAMLSAFLEALAEVLAPFVRR
ncbi:pyridoxal-phosphate-dependent aminotransferase family protein [Megalodesulfovibrio gigas]|uniref:Putative aminotransferase class V n=1 Tax=Megalodesulfovibrio gigas (strain ATCC 19364 / DSM 1382 / NCIMB 9332 / VKM B-1759) TaxID=1121448 RepID=T2G9D4_MEGG1|nr:aminotransferase class V-fold PLP-dependent enzyme [Megalodesulfovibrio gigas]AGW13195.1 putative aminotransferase class V [Megalodesulfovibrio gigas DSM 1382 = ATCC 19364]